MNEAIFWELVGQLDWAHSGDDGLVVEPIVARLAELCQEEIEDFQETLAVKLHMIDGRAWASQSGSDIWWGEPDGLSADGFLYARCVVVANGKAFFEKVLTSPEMMPKDMEFEALLSVAATARDRRLGIQGQIDTDVSYETFSNADGWRPA